MPALAGPWELRFEGEEAWRPVAVPGCWEALPGVGLDRAGPAWYRTTFVMPAPSAGGRAWLRFGAVSYECQVFVNGRPAGAHRGLWDAFTVEVGGLGEPGAAAELLVRVEKPAGLSAGPGSPGLPGRFPLRETLAGFLPYVWGRIFGGIWQDVELLSSGPARLEDVWARGTADGRVRIDAQLSAPAELQVEIYGPMGELVAAQACPRSGRECALELSIPAPRPWSPAAPALYTARLRAADGDERELRFGLRSLSADGRRLRLNGEALYPRMALAWGWYPESLHSNPGPERVRADLLRLKALGYNGVKLCLWFPPAYYFELADELGMLLWVELPLWMPQVTAALREQIAAEYVALVRQARGHPAAILYSLGCELDASVDAGLLAPLYETVKRLAGDALVRDNSGSGEAFGGLPEAFADYDDNHFYAELHQLRGLLDRFAPRWRTPRPWLLGECGDSDTFRDLRALGPDESRPWWAAADPARNPQGARYQYDLGRHEGRLRAAGLWERGPELVALSTRQALLMRKHTIETLRAAGELGGYVISGAADTPITTAGMWDDAGELKFDPAAFRAFNSDLVLLLGWGRRREWLAGGDRPAFDDTWGFVAGRPVRAHLIAAHAGAPVGPAELRWVVEPESGPALAAGAARVEVAPGEVRELAAAAFALPEVDTPLRLTLRAELMADGRAIAANAWPLWAYPRAPWPPAGVGLADPSGRLADLGLPIGQDSPAVLVATAWTAQVQGFVDAGGAAVLLQAPGGPPGPLPAQRMPFWREAIRIVEPHPAWGDFPRDEEVGLQFYGCAADCALDLAGSRARPILRRLDARTMAEHAYIAELAWGRGRLIVSTLRVEGGQGDQPSGLSRNIAAAHLLRCWARYLLTASS